MKINAYVAVFGIIGIIVVAAAVSSLVSPPGQASATAGASRLPSLGKAPDFVEISAWINSPPLNLSQLKGRVVLVDFWTYSCINCIREIPYLNAWYAKYGRDGLTVVGVHTPEFQFERNYSNVLAAVKSLGIKYPVALDNNYSTWNVYGNEYWPSEYVIDQNGMIRHTQIGEGDYNETETVIRELLQSAGYSVGSGSVSSSVNATAVNFSKIGTPEIYVGYNTIRGPIGNPQGFSPEHVVNYTIGGALQNNTVYFSGRWYNANDSMIAAGNDSKAFLIYDAKAVNIVAQGNSSTIEVNLDGGNLPMSYLGSDMVLKGNVASVDITMARLYNLVDAPSYGWHEIEIMAQPGFRLYTFTFG
jgi:thiol-disulfide isomerase/thioredoxin